jgi:Zn-dependent protease with chaperone function
MKQNQEEGGPATRVENLAGSAKDYAEMRIDAFKLRLTEKLSLLFSRIVFSLILVVLLGIACAFLASALSLYIGDLIGSKAAGSLITASIFMVLAIVVYLNRKKFFLDSMVRLFVSIIFENENEEEKS